MKIFDYIENINKIKDLNFFNSVTESDEKIWSTYMINKFLSMNANIIHVVNFIQKYNIPNNILNLFYIKTIPKNNYRSEYIKSDKENDNKKIIIKNIQKFYDVSEYDANIYFLILIKDDKKIEIERILLNNGFLPKDVKKVLNKI